MFAAFSTALSALDANGVAVDVAGNNLANLNTPGYKESAAYFHDLVSESIGTGQTQLGFGVAPPLTVRQFTQGAIQASSGLLDAGIQGQGFFVVNNNGVTQYTRAGNFQTDLSGNLLTPTGEQVQGWMASGGVVNTGGAIGNITVPVGSMDVPSPTTTFSLSANFNAAANTTAVDNSSSWSAPVTAYDSLGTPHVLTFNFAKTAANTWSYTATIPGADASPQQAAPFTVATGGVLSFNPDGSYNAAGSTIAAIGPITLSDGAKPLSPAWNVNPGDLTQYDQASAPSGTTADGSAAAQLTKVTMGNGGQLVASYSNGQQLVVGQLALANIRNPQTLIAVGNNEYDVSATTAQPAVGMPGTGGRGTIVGGSLESSNVDMAQELTELIVLQSAYQANSKVVTTVNTLAQTTSDLIR